jgi:hypothetical protein
MKGMIKYPRSATAIFCIGGCLLLLAQCVGNDSGKQPAPAGPPGSSVIHNDPSLTRDQFAGSESCARCHKKIYDSHIHTAHYLTTRPASEKYIKGNFHTGKNSFTYDSGMVVVMEKRDSGLFQVGYYKGVEKITKRFDIVVGSGSKGQTYIYRTDNWLFQLPVSYFTAANEWANSPLFPTYPVVFNRPVTSRCLECHTTFAKKISPPRVEHEEFDHDQMIYGVDCEKCHGPAAKHVEFQTQNPTVTTAKYIINPAHFSRQQTLDLCGLCHGGRLRKTKASFTFTAGDKLSDYFVVDPAMPDPANIDVHGNQYGLLRSSQCFQMSAMTCVTCHNTHENERGKIALFSQRCMACHGGAHPCKMTAAIGPSITQNCISCHMPLQASRSIRELLPGASAPTAAMIRSHYIKIYPDETKEFMSHLAKTRADKQENKK